MNRTLRRQMSRFKLTPSVPPRVRIPKIVLMDRDFCQIDLLLLKLRKGEVETVDGHVIMTTAAGEVYRVVPAMEGWIEYWQAMARKAHVKYDDRALVKIKNALRYDMPITPEQIDAALDVVNMQKRIYHATPAQAISSEASTQQIRMLMEDNALGEGRERGILREASSGEAATSTDGLEGKGA